MLGDAESRGSARPLVTARIDQPSLLYVSPVIPLLGGNGLAMRAGMVLEALSRAYRVSLLVVPLYPPFDSPIPEYFQLLCERSVCTAPNSASTVLRSISFDAVHVFRLAALPFATTYFASGCLRCLDLDDIESLTHRRIAALYRENGDQQLAESASADAARYAMLEGLALRKVDRVYVCSRQDQELLSGRYPAEIVVLPNAVRPPAHVLARDTRTFRFLFIGTLGYYPNHDAVLWFCSAILPLIAGQALYPFEVVVAGRGASQQLVDALPRSNVTFLGEVPDVQPCYNAAHAVVAPLRAGGGSRIKILEAFSFGRPVVTTSVGLEGIEAEDRKHVLVRETPETFASGCLEIMRDAELGERLARNASSLWSRDYSAEALGRTVSSLATFRAHPRSSPKA